MYRSQSIRPYKFAPGELTGYSRGTRATLSGRALTMSSFRYCSPSHVSHTGLAEPHTHLTRLVDPLAPLEFSLSLPQLPLVRFASRGLDPVL